jgi:hypothetical protein
VEGMKNYVKKNFMTRDLDKIPIGKTNEGE